MEISIFMVGIICIVYPMVLADMIILFIKLISLPIFIIIYILNFIGKIGTRLGLIK